MPAGSVYVRLSRILIVAFGRPSACHCVSASATVANCGAVPPVRTRYSVTATSLFASHARRSYEPPPSIAGKPNVMNTRIGFVSSRPVPSASRPFSTSIQTTLPVGRVAGQASSRRQRTSAGSTAVWSTITNRLASSSRTGGAARPGSLGSP